MPQTSDDSLIACGMPKMMTSVQILARNCGFHYVSLDAVIRRGSLSENEPPTPTMDSWNHGIVRHGYPNYSLPH